MRKNPPPGWKEATNFLCLHLVVVKSWNSNFFSVLQVCWCKVKLEFEIWKCHSSSWVMRSQHSGWGVTTQFIAHSEYTSENWTICKTQSHGRCGVWVSNDFPLLKTWVTISASIPLVPPGCRKIYPGKIYIAIEIIIPQNEDDVPIEPSGKRTKLAGKSPFSMEIHHQRIHFPASYLSLPEGIPFPSPSLRKPRRKPQLSPLSAAWNRRRPGAVGTTMIGATKNWSYRW